ESDGGERLAPYGIEIEPVAEDDNGRPNLELVLQRLAARGITRLLVEGGPDIHSAFIDRKLVDELHFYRSPLLIGGGKPGIGVFGSGALVSAQRLTLVERQ